MNTLHRQRGLTLMELLIAGTLGLIVSAAVMSLVISSNRTAVRAEQQAYAHETARLAIQYLAQALRSAGMSVEDGDLDPFSAPCAGSSLAIGCSDERSDFGGDRISLLRVMDAANNIACNGLPFPNLQGQVVADDYWVDQDTQGRWGLFCQTSHQKNALFEPQMLAQGIIALHALYGQSSAISPLNARNVDRYSPLHELETNSIGDIDWQRVYAIRIALLSEATLDLGLQRALRRFVLLDSDTYEFDDGISRSVMTTTITRNSF
ncbi:MAG: PilW family protein [Bacterioplanes sp.]|nr:PilW family protein [Bacterioplanes sp.]